MSTGPSIPLAFGLTERLQGYDGGIFPSRTEKLGIRIVSINLMLDDPEAPVVWRGPIVSGVVKQFYTDVVWDEIDVLLLDMPPVRGRAADHFPVPAAGRIVIVSTPQIWFR